MVLVYVMFQTLCVVSIYSIIQSLLSLQPRTLPRGCLLRLNWLLSSYYLAPSGSLPSDCVSVLILPGALQLLSSYYLAPAGSLPSDCVSVLILPGALQLLSSYYLAPSGSLPSELVSVLILPLEVVLFKSALLARLCYLAPVRKIFTLPHYLNRVNST